MTLRKKLEQAINSVSAENGSNTPDFILADYLMACLAAYDCATVRREEWHGRRLYPGKDDGAPPPDGWRKCEFCGCNTNAKLRGCWVQCEKADCPCRLPSAKLLDGDKVRSG